MSEETSTLSGTSEVLLAEVTDEFLDRLNRGEQPDIEQYAERHPEIAAVIRQVFPALQALRLPAAKYLRLYFQSRRSDDDREITLMSSNEPIGESSAVHCGDTGVYCLDRVPGRPRDRAFSSSGRV